MGTAQLQPQHCKEASASGDRTAELCRGLRCGGAGEYIAVEAVEAVFKKNPILEQIWVYGNSFESCLVAVVVPAEVPPGIPQDALSRPEIPWLPRPHFCFSLAAGDRCLTANTQGAKPSVPSNEAGTPALEASMQCDQSRGDRT